MSYLVDTNVLVAVEQDRHVGAPPEGYARISVATLTELEVGVRRAPDAAVRELREETLARARRFIAVPYDEVVSAVLAEILATAKERRRRAGAMDAIIAATAIAHDLTVWTQDDDFAVLAELMPALRVHSG
ncbi:PIN domain-containing protein [Svornostia abyssi]|uniref:Ribonuclease VapC n=1 Tax=Svornostia abyssi TaxID=2898438 RepID=A0ABY5PJD3_9ACTN|nr:PIN domain-containing protein [Parviterribacteraceae bacterium J379]